MSKVDTVSEPEELGPLERNPVARAVREELENVVIDTRNERAILGPGFGEVSYIKDDGRMFFGSVPLYGASKNPVPVLRGFLDYGEWVDADGLAWYDGSKPGYGPTGGREEVLKRVLGGRRPDNMPSVWKVEDWHAPERHPYFPDQWVRRLPRHRAVVLEKRRFPWEIDEWSELDRERAIWRRLDIPEGWELIRKVSRKNHPLERMYRNRRENERMMNVIITARDSQTGTGKTTLAVDMAKRWDENGWSADKATLDPSEYRDMYHQVDPGAVLILDEAEQAADNRRSMSDQNLTLSHLWATMRFKQVSSIITLPTVTMLDKRLKELADVRIHVRERGFAKVYKVKVEDTGEHRVFEKHICNQLWDSMDDDPDYQELSRKKAERMKDYSVGDDDDDSDDSARTKREIELDKRNQVIRQMSREGDLTHEEIGEIVGLSRSTVSKIVSGNN